MIYFFHHYELPAILQQARIQQIIIETQQQSNESSGNTNNNTDDTTDGSGGSGNGSGSSSGTSNSTGDANNNNTVSETNPPSNSSNDIQDIQERPTNSENIAPSQLSDLDLNELNLIFNKLAFDKQKTHSRSSCRT